MAPACTSQHSMICGSQCEEYRLCCTACEAHRDLSRGAIARSFPFLGDIE